AVMRLHTRIEAFFNYAGKQVCLRWAISVSLIPSLHVAVQCDADGLKVGVIVVCRLYCQVFVECVIHNLSFRNYDLIGLYVAGLYFTTAEACHFAWRGFMSSISNASFTAIS